jgi:hypothetical protein
MQCNPRSSNETLHNLRSEIAVIRGTAQFLLRRLDRQIDTTANSKAACRVIIEQTRLIESLIPATSDGSLPQEAFSAGSRLTASIPLLCAIGDASATSAESDA